MVFAPNQKTDVGFVLPEGADATSSSILVTGYDVCGTKEGLKKDSKAKTVPIGEVAVPQAEEPAPVAPATPAKKKVRII